MPKANRRRLLVALVICLPFLGAGIWWMYYQIRPHDSLPRDSLWALGNPDRLELFSLDPDPTKTYKSKEPHFHHYRILGSTLIVAPETQRLLVSELQKGVAENEGKPLRCFDPRHGVRAVRGDKTFDLVICFHCYQIVVFRGIEGEDCMGVLTTRSPQATLDNLLRTANVPLAPKAE